MAQNISFPTAIEPDTVECERPGPAKFSAALAQGDFLAAVTLAETEAELWWSQAVTQVIWQSGSDGGFPQPPEDAGALPWTEVEYAYAWSRGDYARIGRIKGADRNDAFPRMATAWAEGSRTPTFAFPDSTVSVPMRISSGKNPLVEVKVNGVSHWFWVDTGAGVTVLSSRIAQAVGIAPLGGYAEIGTSTRHRVWGRPAVIDSLEIGGFCARNQPAVILRKRDLALRLFGIPLLRIDGIVGWPLLRELDVELNVPGRTLTLRPSQPDPADSPQIGWYWQPFVEVATPPGCTLRLKLDTGSAKTFFHPSAYPKLGVVPRNQTRTLRTGVGATKLMRTDQLERVRLVLGEQLVEMAAAEGFPEEPNAKEELMRFDGVIGQDILGRGTVRIDFRNRRFRFFREAR
ncbi:MAG: retropepsin-like aspartic protease [Bacteroidota bacterium]